MFIASGMVCTAKMGRGKREKMGCCVPLNEVLSAPTLWNRAVSLRPDS